MDKLTKIKVIQRMLKELSSETFYGGFDELDQAEIEFVQNELLYHVDHKGLDKFIDLLERVSKSGVNRNKPLTQDEIKQNLKRS